MRFILVVFHRWLGLTAAAFFCVTGAVISWDPELDEFLNPHLMKVAGVAEPGCLWSLRASLRFEIKMFG